MADRDTDADDPRPTPGPPADGPAVDAASPDDPRLPADIVARALSLTRRMRQAVDEDERAAYREERDRLLVSHDYVPRVRDDDTGETLVLYPAEWVEEGVVRVDRIEDTDRAVERSLSGVGSDDWDAVETHNRRVADRVAEVHGDPHGATAHAFAAFMHNHYAKRVEMATPAERREFREEYFPRNAWPTEDQRAAIEESLRRVEEIAAGE
jgi:hypothetical protein